MSNSAKSTAEKIYISFHLEISYSSVQSINMSRFFKRNGSLSQTLKPIIIERASYCIQFKNGTKNGTNFKKKFQASEQIIIDLSEWTELESKIIRELRKNWQCLSHLREKSTGFHMIQMTKILTKLWIWDTVTVFICLQKKHLLQMIFFEKMVEFEIFYRDPKKVFSLLRVYLHAWRKIERIHDTRYKKEKLKVQQNNLALFRIKNGVAQKQSDNELKN